MALTVSQAEGLKYQQTFKDRVEYALLTTCFNVYSEGAGVTNHAIRATRATAIVNSPSGYVDQYARGVITQLNKATVSLTADSADCDATDAVISTACASIFNAYAGA